MTEIEETEEIEAIEAIGAAEIETAIEMVGEDHEAIRLETSALSASNLVIGKYYWQLYFKDNPNL